VYCANFLADTVTVIDTAAGARLADLPVGRAPCAMTINSANQSAYVVNSASDSLSRIDLLEARVASETAVGRGPVGIAVSPSGDRVYAGDRAEGTVSVVGAQDDLEWARIPVGEAPAGFAVDDATGYLFVSNAGSHTVTVLEDRLSGPVPGAREEARHPLIGRPLPGFALPDLHTGALRHSREWDGRKYILHFFASW
jgi:YVTN family beta-propeller protein